MGPKSHFPYSFLLVTVVFFIAGYVQARDTQFFSKVSRLDDETKTSQKVESAKAPTASTTSDKEDDDPVFIPQIGHTGYGLYGKTSSKEGDEVKFYRTYNSGGDDNNNNEKQQNTMLYGNSNNMERYEQQSTSKQRTSVNLPPVDWNNNYYKSRFFYNSEKPDNTRSRYVYNSEKPGVGMNEGRHNYNYYYYDNHNTAVDEQRYRQQYNQNGMQSGSQFEDGFNFNP